MTAALIFGGLATAAAAVGLFALLAAVASGIAHDRFGPYRRGEPLTAIAPKTALLALAALGAALLFAAAAGRLTAQAAALDGCDEACLITFSELDR